jgi:hypothetical protein
MSLTTRAPRLLITRYYKLRIMLKLPYAGRAHTVSGPSCCGLAGVIYTVAGSGISNIAFGTPCAYCATLNAGCMCDYDW